jgi:LPPG:FO 2-phospho-L-lactate transferase
MLPALDGQAPSAGAVARHYGSLLSGFVVEHGDEAEVQALGLPVHATGSVMRTLQDRARLARDVLRFAETLT